MDTLTVRLSLAMSPEPSSPVTVNTWSTSFVNDTFAVSPTPSGVIVTPSDGTLAQVNVTLSKKLEALAVYSFSTSVATDSGPVKITSGTGASITVTVRLLAGVHPTVVHTRQ